MDQLDHNKDRNNCTTGYKYIAHLFQYIVPACAPNLFITIVHILAHDLVNLQALPTSDKIQTLNMSISKDNMMF